MFAITLYRQSLLPRWHNCLHSRRGRHIAYGLGAHPFGGPAGRSGGDGLLVRWPRFVADPPIRHSQLPGRSAENGLDRYSNRWLTRYELATHRTWLRPKSNLRVTEERNYEMAMKQSGSRPGGGPNSKNVVNKPQRLGTPAKGVSPGWASQIGSGISNHSTDHSKVLPYKGEAMRDGLTPAGGKVPLGNQIANNVGAGGPGTGREVMHCGTQSTYGAANPGNPPPKGELFPGWPVKK